MPEGTIKTDLERSMSEENQAAQVYLARAGKAMGEGDNRTEKLYLHIAGEEGVHRKEFNERLNEIIGKDADDVVKDAVIGALIGDGAIPLHGRESRKAVCRACRIDPTKPLEAGNVMATTEDAIGTLSKDEVRDWCSELVEVGDGRCHRSLGIREAAKECKEQHPSDTKAYFDCFLPRFTRLTSSERE